MLKRSVLLLVVTTLLACTPENQQPSVEMLTKAIDEFNAAFERGDVDKLDQMITENYVHTNSSWKSFGKEKWLGYMRDRSEKIESGALRIQTYEMQEVAIEMITGGAIVTGKILVSGVEDEVPFSRQIRVTNVWVLVKEKWKRAGFHDTGIVQ